MIKRVLRELLTEWRLMVFYLFLMLIVMLVMLMFEPDFSKFQGCGMDVFAFSSKYMAYGVFVTSIFLSISINKSNFKPQRVVLSKKTSSVWNYTIVKTITISLIMSVFIFIITAIISIACFSDLFNWNLEESFFYNKTGVCMDSINYPIIFTAYFCQIFFGICMAAIIPMVIFWLFKSYLVGAAIGTIIFFAAEATGSDFLYKQNIYYDKMIYGMDFRYHFIFPAIVLVILMVAGSLKTKRDYI